MSKSPSLRRIQADIRELSIDPSTQYHAAPLEDDMFVWHFTIRGAVGTDFEGGIYHGKILLPAEYPFKPPNIIFMTPSGRFETNVKVCLSFSAYHPELWQPAWGIRLILEALVSFLPSKADGAIGALDWTSEERKRLAKKSVDFVCPICGKCSDIMKQVDMRVKNKRKSNEAGSGTKSRFQKEIEQLHALQAAAEGVDDEDRKDKGGTAEKDKKEAATMVENDDGKTNEESDDDDKTVETKHDDENANDVDTIGDSNEKNTSAEDAEEDQTDGSNASDNIAHVDVPKEANATGIEDEEQEEVHETSQESNPGSTTTDTEETTGEQAAIAMEQNLESPLLSDPVVHAGIVIFSAIIYLLVRKLQEVIVDMKELEAQFRA